MNFYEGYVEFKPSDKQDYFKSHYPFDDGVKLTDKKHCIHCGKDFVVGDYKVFKENGPDKYHRFEYICCPNAPECDGTIIDWREVGSSISYVDAEGLLKLNRYHLRIRKGM